MVPRRTDGGPPMIGTNTQPLNEWREVCRWEVPETPAFKVVDKPLEVDWQATAKYWEEQWRLEGTRAKDADFFMREAMDYQRAFTHALAAFEELAGEHLRLRDMLQDIITTGDSLKPTEDQVSVRPYVRAKPRRSKPVTTEPTPTEDIGEGVSESQAKAEGQPRALGLCQTCAFSLKGNHCGTAGFPWCPDPIPQSGEERRGE